MPVIFLVDSHIFINEGTKCYVTFFFTFSLIVGIVFLYLVLIYRFIELKSKSLGLEPKSTIVKEQLVGGSSLRNVVKSNHSCLRFHKGSQNNYQV